jgi:uncharacterized membrane protein YfcA
MESILLFILVTIGSFISSLTGLAGGTLILAGLLLFFSPSIALPLHSFTQLSSNSLRSGLFFKHVDWKTVFFYFLLMIPATWLGAMIFHLINPSWLKILVGLLILISILPWKIKSQKTPSSWIFFFLGGISGFLSVFVGAVGPLVTPFFNRLNLSRQGMLSTKSAGQALLQVSKIFAFWGAADVNFDLLKENILLLVLATLLGVALSIPISRKISDQRFNLMVNALLVLISLKVLSEGILELLK